MSRIVFVFLAMLIAAPSLAAPAKKPAVAQTVDTVIVDAPQSPYDTSNDFSNALLTQILLATKGTYGDFEFKYAPRYYQRDELLRRLLAGDAVNVVAKATQPDFEESGLAVIRIPIDMGITNYRIAFIRRDDQPKFRRITDAEGLKPLKLAVGKTWSTREVFEKLGFTTVLGGKFDELYKSTSDGTADYMPRALSEVFVEWEDIKNQYPNLAIEQSLVVHYPLPKYFFVAPGNRRLMQRITDGFNIIMANGDFRKFVMIYHRSLIEQAGFCTRTIIRLDNPVLSDKTPLSNRALWYDPFAKDPVTGKALCEGGRR